MDHPSPEPSSQSTAETEPPSPQQPGSSRPKDDAGRGDLVLFLGILSLFLCAPLGIAAWVMANGDLKKIRAGRLSPRNMGALKAGKVLGIIGTTLWGMVLIAGIVAIRHGVEITRWGMKSIERSFRPEPLPPHLISYSGQWRGNKGTVIDIHPDGRADFRNHQTTVTGGRVSIEGKALSIGILGYSKTWHIDMEPALEDGAWKMKLDGEEFTRRDSGMMVRQGLFPAACVICWLGTGRTKPRSHKDTRDRSHGIS